MHDIRQVRSSSQMMLGKNVFVGKMLLLRAALICLVPGFLYTLWHEVILIYFG
jgi:hypothetical protein